MKDTLVLLSALVVCAPTPAVGQDLPAQDLLYLGQTPPDSTPELFAPGIVSRDGYFEHSAAVFSSDLREVYWSAKARGERHYDMFVSELRDGQWSEPRVVPFLETNHDEFGPAISPDGNEIYFGRGYGIWVVRRLGAGWSEPELVSDVLIPGRFERIGSVTRDGSLYFTVSTFNPRVDHVYVARRSGDGFSEPQKLDTDFQAGHMAIGGVYVAPDESYMILELQLNAGTSELFVSYRTDDSWTSVVNLPLGFGRFPAVSPDGRYLFYMTHSGIEWVSADMLEELRPDRSE